MKDDPCISKTKPVGYPPVEKVISI